MHKEQITWYSDDDCTWISGQDKSMTYSNGCEEEYNYDYHEVVY